MNIHLLARQFAYGCLSACLSLGFASQVCADTANGVRLVAPENYPFPLQNAYFSTLASAAVQAQTPIRYSNKPEIRIRSDRSGVWLLEDRDKLNFTVRQRGHSAPLVFVVPGLGAFADEGKADFLSELFFQAGFHVVTVPNPFNWRFALSASQTGLVGYVQQDTKDLYQTFIKIKNYLQRQRGMEITGHALVGYSLGGLYAAHISQLDQNLKQFNFKSILILNPPLDLEYGLNKLDEFYLEGFKFSAQQRNKIQQQVFSLGAHFLEIKDPKVSLQKLISLERKKYFSDTAMKYIIGDAFRKSLSDVIFVSQQIKNLGLLKSPLSWGERDYRYAEISNWSFKDYFEKMLFVGLNNKHQTLVSLEEIKTNYSLYQLKNHFTENKNIHFFHNQDDFLFKPTDLEFVASAFGSRAVIFPSGGHCGNYTMPQNRIMMLEALKSGFAQ